MRITFIGMSNIGKSTWSRIIAERTGIERVDCDSLIEKDLVPELRHKGITGVAEWMGFPYDGRYEDTSSRYQALEQAIMDRVVADLRQDEKPAIIDTTGSVIYCASETLAALRSLTKIIYLETDTTHIDALYARFNKHPKPTIWAGKYHRDAGSTPEEALKNSYPGLLQDRNARYQALADIIIPYTKHRDHSLSLAEMTNGLVT